MIGAAVSPLADHHAFLAVRDEVPQAFELQDVAFPVREAVREHDGHVRLCDLLPKVALLPERRLVAALDELHAFLDVARQDGTALRVLGLAAARHDFSAIVPVSATRRENLETLVRAAAAHLPEGPAEEAPPPLERGERFQAAEALREQLTLALSDELPYGLAVEIERFEPTEDGRTEIDAVIWVEREGQRRIVIGAKGERLKGMGRARRPALNELFGRRVHLNTWVKLREGWSDDDHLLRRLGHEPP